MTGCLSERLIGASPNVLICHRQHDSTETANTIVNNNIVRSTNAGLVVSALVLLDLTTAFDTVVHSILLDIFSERLAIYKCSVH